MPDSEVKFSDTFDMSDTYNLKLVCLYINVLSKFIFQLKTRGTVMFLSFRTDRSGQTVKTQIRLLLEEQSDQGLHCLQFSLHLLDALL